MPGRRGGTLQRGGTNPGAGRKPNPVRKAMQRASITAAKTAEQLMQDPEAPWEQRRFAMEFCGRHGIGSVDARVRASAPAQAAQATQVNVNSYRIVGDDEEIPEGVPALEV